jgi:hypothetical protein
MPNNSTVFALEGTAAHEFNEFIMRTGFDPKSFEGGLVDLNGVKGMRVMRDLGEGEDRESKFAITDEMVEGCLLTQSVVAEYYDRDDGDRLLLETRLDMSWVHPDLFGTGDILVYKPKTKHLVVLDYKYGRGVAVDVEDNPQVLTYAVGAARMFADEGVELLTCVIVQPRAFHVDGEVRKQDLDAFDLAIFEDILRAKAAATDDPDAALCAGDQCKWCQVAHACPTLRDYVDDAVGVVFSDDEEPSEEHLPKLIDLTPERLGRLVKETVVIEGWLRRVMQYAHAEALEGRVPVGCKLVEKRASRKWSVDDDSIIAVLDVLGVDEDDYLTPQKLRSPAQIEKAIGKQEFRSSMLGMWKKESTGYVLATDDDRREAVRLDKTDAFGVADDD